MIGATLMMMMMCLVVESCVAVELASLQQQPPHLSAGDIMMMASLWAPSMSQVLDDGDDDGASTKMRMRQLASCVADL